MKKIVSAILLLTAFCSIAQTTGNAEELNNYKFVIVPSKFDFLKEKDQYQLNTFTKMYLEKKGFTVFFDTDALPPEAAGNCNKLFADVVAESNMFITKLSIAFRDCMNKQLFKTDQGTSRDKDYQTSYRQALRAAMKSFDTFDYVYNGQNGVKSLVEQLPEASPTVAAGNSKQEVVVDANTLFAQPIENGYQLVNTEPRVVFKLKKTSSSQVFLAEKGGNSGTLIQKGNGKWVFEYYVDGALKTEEVSIKF